MRLLPAAATIALSTVYQNPSGSSMFISCTVQLVLSAPPQIQGNNVPQHLSLQISASTGSVGVLADTIYEISRRDLTWLSSRVADDQYNFYGSLAGFVPPFWFYKVALPLDATAVSKSGTVIATTRYW
jgi:hypothetical protein